jgi:surface antigen
LALGSTLLLTACGYIPSNWMPPAGFLGRQVNPRPDAPQTTNSGGLHGELIGGSDQSPVPHELADAVVGSELRRWLSPADRMALAEASQQAAVAERNTKIAWGQQAARPSDAEQKPPSDDGATPAPLTSAVGGWAAPISDPYRAGHGALCRDVRQALTRADDDVVQAVTLCREETGLGGTVWVAAHWP